MAKRNQSNIMAEIKAAEVKAINAVKGIGQGRAAAASAMLAFATTCKADAATPAVFEAGLARIVGAAEGADKITIGGYASNCRRIFACPSDKWAEVQKTVDLTTSHIKTVAEACPAVQRAKSDAKKTASAKKKATTPTATDPGAVKVSTPATDPMLALQNDLLTLRKMFGNKRAALALIGEMEDMLGDLKKMAA